MRDQATPQTRCVWTGGICCKHDMCQVRGRSPPFHCPRDNKADGFNSLFLDPPAGAVAVWPGHPVSLAINQLLKELSRGVHVTLGLVQCSRRSDPDNGTSCQRSLPLRATNIRLTRDDESSVRFWVLSRGAVVGACAARLQLMLLRLSCGTALTNCPDAGTIHSTPAHMFLHWLLSSRRSRPLANLLLKVVQLCVCLMRLSLASQFSSVHGQSHMVQNEPGQVPRVACATCFSLTWKMGADVGVMSFKRGQP